MPLPYLHSVVPATRDEKVGIIRVKLEREHAVGVASCRLEDAVCKNKGAAVLVTIAEASHAVTHPADRVLTMDLVASSYTRTARSLPAVANMAPSER